MEASFHNIVSWDCRYTRMTFSQKYECKAVIQKEEKEKTKAKVEEEFENDAMPFDILSLPFICENRLHIQLL